MSVLLLLFGLALVFLVLGLAPTPSSRVTPTGWKMPDGYQTLITFAADTGINLWEKTVKPPGIDGGDAIDTTTMLNTTWRTKDTRHLITLGPECTCVCAYDPDAYGDILALTNRKTTITIKFPENSTLAFYGFLQKADFSELKEGEFPEVTLTIIPTNQDPTSLAEAAPVFTSAAGT